jgi:antitoxin component of RelBE/YafQ-DinJ toxin-antitoxin module
MTVLLNPILEKRGLPLDKDYPKHQELRIKLKELWESKNRTFEDFLNEILTQKLTV